MQPDVQRRAHRRLKILEGQVRGLQRMVSRKAYCIDILTQSSAVREALSGVEDLLLEHHLTHCAVSQIRAGKTTQPAREVLAVYRLAKKT